MTIVNIGNNVYLYRTGEGDLRSNIPVSNKAICIDFTTGIISQYDFSTWNDVSFGARSDQLFMAITRQQTFTNIGTSYVDVFAALYAGFPHGLDTTGFTRFGIVILWNKNGGTGRHDMRLVDAAIPTNVIINTEGRTVANSGADGLANGITKDYDIAIPAGYKNWIGEVKLQVKSTVASDDPIFDAFLLYLRR